MSARFSWINWKFIGTEKCWPLKAGGHQDRFDSFVKMKFSLPPRKELPILLCKEQSNHERKMFLNSKFLGYCEFNISF